MWKEFKVTPFSAGGFLREVAQEMSLGSNSLEAYIKNEGACSGPLNQIIRHLKELNCETVIIEKNYIDRDYLNEFSAFYSRCFKVYPPRCLRLHFSSQKIQSNPSNDYSGSSKESYLGFVVIRPTDRNIIGRTVLRPPSLRVHTEFFTCVAKFEAHILGEAFSITSIPFIQQDTQVGACAHAALWMLARYMSRRFNLREFLPAEINKHAKTHRQLGREYPADKDGLTAEQMLDALRGMGFSAVFYERSDMRELASDLNDVFFDGDQYDFDPQAKKEVEASRQDCVDTIKLADIAYRYIESKLPVIFNFSDHAVVGVGHSYDWQHSGGFTIQRIPSFFIHNDSAGPYMRCPILTREKGVLSFRDVKGIIAVTPPTATLLPEDAESAAKNTILTLPDLLVQRTQDGATIDDVLKKIGIDISSYSGNLEYRTYLRDSTDFLREVRRASINAEFDSAVAEKLLSIDYPKFVWITEVSLTTFLGKELKHERKCIGRVIVDSTAARKSKCVIAMHYCGWFIVEDRQGRLPAFSAFYENSTPFTHWFTTE